MEQINKGLDCANIRETITALLKKMYGGDNNGK